MGEEGQIAQLLGVFIGPGPPDLAPMGNTDMKGIGPAAGTDTPKAPPPCWDAASTIGMMQRFS